MRALRALSWPHRVTVTLADHLFAEKINAAVNRGEGFGEAFADAGGDVAQLRNVFRRKAYLGRMATLIDALRKAGQSDTDLTMTLATFRRPQSHRLRPPATRVADPAALRGTRVPHTEVKTSRPPPCPFLRSIR
jgi:hypothetical protein